LRTIRDHEVNFEPKEGATLDQEGAQRIFRQAPAERRAMQETLDKHVATGLLTPRKSRFASPGFIVFAKDAAGKKVLTKHRLVGDYRRLNKITRRIHYGLPRIDQLIADVGCGLWYSEFDFLSGFNQVAVGKKSSDAFSLVMSQGCFAQTRMPQGWINSSPFFQGCVDADFCDMQEFVKQYIDDSTLYTPTENGNAEEIARELDGMFREERLQALTKQVLEEKGENCAEFLKHTIQVAMFLNRCREQRYTISAEKAVMFKDRVTLLGFDLGPHGTVRVTKKRVRAFRMRPRPVVAGGAFEEEERDDGWYHAKRTTADAADSDSDKGGAVLEAQLDVDLKAVRSFLGTAGYYRGLIRDFAAVAAPLQRHLRKKNQQADAEEENPKWGEEEEFSFRQLLHLLCTCAISSPQEGCTKAVETDWSLDGMGCVCYQYVKVRGDAPALQDEQGKFLKGIMTKTPANLEKLGWRKEAIAGASRALTPAESRFDPRSGEAAAIGLALKKFRCYLLGEEFLVITDHSSLQWLQESEVTQRMGRLACLLSEFDYQVIHKPGGENVVPDHLSRYPPKHPDPDGDDEQDENDLAAILEVESKQEKGNSKKSQATTAKALLHRGCKIPGCGTCAQTKQTVPRKQKQRAQPAQRENAFNYRVLMDDLGKVEPSYWGNEWAQVQRDQFTGWTQVHTSARKDKKAHEKAILGWEKDNGRFAETTVEEGADPIAVETTWRTDGGIHTAGRKSEVVEPYSHHKAGGAERAIRSETEDTRVILHGARKRVDFKDFPWMRKRGVGPLWDVAGRYASVLSNFCSYKKGHSPRTRRQLPPTQKQLFPFGQPVVYVLPREKRKKARRFHEDGYARRGMFLGWSNTSGIGGGYVVLEAGEKRGRMVVTTAIRAVEKR
jgi:hypothetical protein